jgi:hypothetical protein
MSTADLGSVGVVTGRESACFARRRARYSNVTRATPNPTRTRADLQLRSRYVIAHRGIRVHNEIHDTRINVSPGCRR